MYKSAISMVLIVTLSGLLQGCLGPAVVSAGIGAAMMAEDPRTAGVIVDDRIIVSKLSSRIKDKYPDKAKIHPMAFDFSRASVSSSLDFIASSSPTVLGSFRV